MRIASAFVARPASPTIRAIAVLALALCALALLGSAVGALDVPSPGRTPEDLLLGPFRWEWRG